MVQEKAPQTVRQLHVGLDSRIAIETLYLLHPRILEHRTWSTIQQFYHDPIESGQL